jgi:hypothetical protein
VAATSSQNASCPAVTVAKNSGGQSVLQSKSLLL